MEPALDARRDVSPGTPAWRRHQLLLVSLATLVLMLALGELGKPLTTAAAPYGIVSIELAPSAEEAAHILASWDTEALQAAWLVQALDLLYPLAYAAWFSLACAALARRLPASLLARSGHWLARWIWLAAGFDYLENAGICMQLWRGASAFWAPLTFAASLPKWILVAAAALYLCAAGVAALAVRRPAR